MGNSERDAAARSRAQALWGKEKKKGEEFLKARDKERQEEAAKVARLRGLRLAKEEADKKSADAAPAARRKTPR
ncbi:MAG TPA: hypothetical protein VK690_02265 [Stellaceae bacterium]|jgi:hypothetical protein|nr:hypothetical protein [Stellaceae bacterium]